MGRLPRGVARGPDGVARCFWAASDPLYLPYHDEEWGVPVADDRRLFEKICLEGFQSGLSWLTILRKREGFRRAFRDFDFEVLARFNRRHVARLLRDPAIVRHRGKIESTIHNARRAMELREEFSSLAGYLWRWRPRPEARPSRITYHVLRRLSTSPEAIALSRDLKARGWTFVGPTTVYAFMQAMGLVNDHIEGCAVRDRVEEAFARFEPPTRGLAVAGGPLR